MPTYRVTRGVWQRPSGETVAQGSTFEATEREAARIARRPWHRDQLELVGATPPAADGVGAQSTANSPALPSSTNTAGTGVEDSSNTGAGESSNTGTGTGSPPPPPDWSLKMTPERYLQLHPDGQHADLARAVIAARPATAESGEGK